MAKPSKTKDPTDSGTQKTRAEPIPWDKNPAWLERILEFLGNAASFRNKLFSDSNTKAAKEGRTKVVGSDSKATMFQQLAGVVFGRFTPGPEFGEAADQEMEFETKISVPRELRDGYAADPKRFGLSLQQQFAKLRTTYRGYMNRLRETGGGIKEGSEYDNLMQEFRDEWPLFDTLDGFWHELPNFNPIGVSNGKHGQDHAGKAAEIFKKDAKAKRSTKKGKVGDDLDSSTSSDEEDGPGNGESAGSGVEDADMAVIEKTPSLPSTPRRSPRKHKQPARAVSPSPAAVSPITTTRKSQPAKGVHNKVKPHRDLKKRGRDAIDDGFDTDLASLSKRQEERNQLRLAQAENERTRLELEKAKFDAKKRKLELKERELKLQEMRAERESRIFEQMMARMMGSGVGSFGGMNGGAGITMNTVGFGSTHNDGMGGSFSFTGFDASSTDFAYPASSTSGNTSGNV